MKLQSRPPAVKTMSIEDITNMCGAVIKNFSLNTGTLRLAGALEVLKIQKHIVDYDTFTEHEKNAVIVNVALPNDSDHHFIVFYL